MIRGEIRGEIEAGRNPMESDSTEEYAIKSLESLSCSLSSLLSSSYTPFKFARLLPRPFVSLTTYTHPHTPTMNIILEGMRHEAIEVDSMDPLAYSFLIESLDGVVDPAQKRKFLQCSLLVSDDELGQWMKLRECSSNDAAPGESGTTPFTPSYF